MAAVEDEIKAESKLEPEAIKARSEAVKAVVTRKNAFTIWLTI